MSEVRISITGDASGFNKSVAQGSGAVADLQKRIDALTQSRDKFTNPSTVENYNRKITELKGQQDALKKSTDANTEAKANFGKVSAMAGNQVSQAFKAIGIDVEKYGQVLSTVKTGTQAATGATTGLGTAMKAIPIVAIVGAFLALVKAFTSTQEGADRLARILEPLKAIFAAIWGVIQDLALALSDKLVAAFDDPIGAMKSFGEFLVSQVVNRITGLLELIPALGRSIVQLFQRDFSGAAETASNAVLKVVTGVENLGTSIAEAGKELTELGRRAAATGDQIQALDKQIRRTRIEQAESLARLNREFQELNTLARDVTKTDEERLAAADAALKIREKIRDEEVRLLNLQIRQLELRQSLNDTNDEELLKLAQLRAQRDAAAAAAVQESRRLESTRNSILQGIDEQANKEAEAEEARLDALRKRGEAFLQITLTEEEIRQNAYEKALAELQTLVDAQIVTEADALRVREALYEEFYGKIAKAKAEEVKKTEEAERKKAEAVKLANAQILGDSLATEIQRAKSVAKGAKGVIRAITAEIIARMFQKVITGLPFPANIALAPVAAAAAGRAANAIIPGFRDGGLVGGGERIIRINEVGQEFVTNAATTRAALPLLSAMNANPNLASAVNSQFTGKVSLNDNGLTDRLGALTDRMERVEFVFRGNDFIGGWRELDRIDRTRTVRTE